MVEIVIPSFDLIDVPVGLQPGMTTSLRKFAFEITAIRKKLKVDIDNGTRSGETVLLVQGDQRPEAMDLIAQWLKKHHDFTVIWETSLIYKSSTFKLNPEARAVATKLTAAAEDLQKEFPALPTKLPAQKSDPAPRGNNLRSNPRNTWVDIAKLPQIKPGKVIAHEATSDNHTATTSSSTWAGASSTMAPDFHTLRKNITTVALHHKSLEAKVLENFLDDQRQFSNLTTMINSYCSRLTGLEMARNRQAQINQAQIKVSLDPSGSIKDGTVTKLMELLEQDYKSVIAIN